MKHRKLRIAWSVAWGIAAVLLIALWVRSAHHFEGISWMPSNQRYFDFESMKGEIRCMSAMAGSPATTLRGWRVFSLGTDLLDPALSASMPSFHGFGVHTDSANFAFCLPYWFSILVAGFLSAAPWLPRRFSLRTLLIATTLVAVVPGTIIVLTR